MAKSHARQWIPTHLSLEQFEEFVLPHLHIGSRGPQPKLALHAIFNYILKLLYLGCQWKELPIEKDTKGRPEIHYSSIYRAFRRFETHGCFDAIFAGSVSQLKRSDHLDINIIHGDGTTTAAKKGGDNLGYSGHKHIKGDKVVAFCERNYNFIAPFVTAPGNRHESPLLSKALSHVARIAQTVGIELKKYDSQLGFRLRQPSKPESHFQSWHDSEHSRKSAEQKDRQTGTQAIVQAGNLSREVFHD